MNEAFDAVERNGETIWVHKTAPVWVVHYSAIEDSQSFRREFWQPYRAIEAIRKGRQVWTANNKRVGKEGEFLTLEAALQAGEIAAELKVAA